jgi:alpha-L-rhamnosidase
MGLENVSERSGEAKRLFTIKESGKTLFHDGSYVDGVAGITGGSEDTNYVTFDVGSGSYSFDLRN